MTKNYLEIKSELAKAKNLGSSHHGSHHWIIQRLSAVLLVPLFLWLAYFLHLASKMSFQEVLMLLRHPLHLISGVMFLSISLYHGMLGMQVVIEDYISCIKVSYFLIISLKLFTFVTIFSLGITTLYFLTQS